MTTMHPETSTKGNFGVKLAVRDDDVAPDGRPWRTAAPAPNTKQIEQDNFPTVFNGYAPELTKENLDTPDKHNAALHQFMDSGFCSMAAGSRGIVKLMEFAIREFHGERLSSEEFTMLEAARQRIRRFNEAADIKLKEIERGERKKQLEVKYRHPAKRLEVYKDILAQAENLISNGPKSLGDMLEDLVGQPGAAIAHVGRIAGAKEIAQLLRKELIPAAEKELADTAAALAEAV